MKKKCILTTYMILAIFSGIKLYAQDPHFSQYFASPMTLSPALTGRGVTDWRLSSVYRTQWWMSYGVPFTTTTVSVEKNMTAGRDNKNNLGFGISMLSDASNGGLLKNNYFSFAGAYHVAFDEEGKTMLSGGIMATYANRLLDPNRFEFQDQYGSMGFQRSVPSADPVTVLSNNYWDANAGLHFSRDFTSWGYDAGAAIYHLSRPSEGAYGNFDYSISPRYSLQGGVHVNFKNNNRLNARLISEIQGQNSIFTLGGVYGLDLGDDTFKSFDLGLWHRFGDAFYPYAGISGANWQAGISYDIVVSQVKTAYNAVQSMEFSLVWQFKSKKLAASERVSAIRF
jgi:type IX secretion system PorP/SprF family membrane protein